MYAPWLRLRQIESFHCLLARAEKEATEERAALADEMQRIAKELRHSQDELNLAIEAAEKANRTKNELLGNMSHEIRTPMNGIMGMAELLPKTDVASQQLELLDIIQQPNAPEPRNRLGARPQDACRWNKFAQGK